MGSTQIWALELPHLAYNLGFTYSNYHLHNSKTEHTVLYKLPKHTKDSRNTVICMLDYVWQYL